MTRRRGERTNMLYRSGAALAAAALAFLIPVCARADVFSAISSNMLSFGDLLLPDIDHVTVGVGPKYTPDYLGSDNYHVVPDLVFVVRFAGRVFASNQGLEVNLLGFKSLQFGPSLTISGKRNESDNPILAGLGDVKRGPELGLFLRSTWQDMVTVRLRVRQGVARGHEGTLIDLVGSSIVYRGDKDRFQAYVGASTTWSSGTYARAFFGISEEHSLNSGLPVYTPGNSIRDVSLLAGTRWSFKPDWSLNLLGEYRRLTADAARSPLVATYGSPDNLSLSLTVTRTFRLH